MTPQIFAPNASKYKIVCRVRSQLWRYQDKIHYEATWMEQQKRLVPLAA
ncbi:MAG TPA: hypothetical protein V6D31_04415 [Candidatus Sericytochromatia bacterium]